MGISKAETSGKQNEQNIGQRIKQKSDKTNRTQKSDKKSEDIVGQKITQRDRTRRHRTINWDKKSDGKTSQKSDI